MKRRDEEIKIEEEKRIRYLGSLEHLKKETVRRVKNENRTYRK